MLGALLRRLPAAAQLWRAAAPSPRTLCAAAAHEECLYRVLGAQPNASQDELKKCFRARARVLHPDASPEAGGQPDRAAFVELLGAYQVLSNPRARQLYDMSRDRANPAVLRAAAASGVPGAAAAAYEDIEVDLSWGLGRLFKQPPAGAPPAALDRVRQELQGELHSAVRRAYLGPRLEQELEGGRLPPAFEADERAAPDCPDLLQLVSGRLVLGAVRDRRLELLQRQAAAAAALQDGQQRSQQQEQSEQREEERCDEERPQGAPPAAMHAAASAEQQEQQAQQAQKGQQAQREPDVLDLLVGEQVVASAVRHFPPQQQEQPGQPEQPEQPGQQQPRGTVNGSSGSGGGGSSSSGGGGGPPPEVVCVYGRGGELLGQVEAQQLDPGSATASSARLLNADGLHTHTVYRTQSPLVRHLTFAAEPGATRLKTRRPSRLIVCRARRAWLPPSSLWLFKPLSHDFDIGGWYLEWAGAEQEGHPAALHPAVFVLTAAFDSLDHERASRQPLGLFGRLRAARDAAAAAARGQGGAAGQGEEQGGWRGWLGSALRFHGYRRR